MFRLPLIYAAALLVATACLPHAFAFSPMEYSEAELRAIKMKEALRWDPALNVTYTAEYTSENGMLVAVEVRVTPCKQGGATCFLKKHTAALATMLKSHGSGSFDKDFRPSKISTTVYYGSKVVKPRPLPTKGPQALALAVRALKGNALFTEGEAGNPMLSFNSWHIIFKAKALQYRGGFDGGNAEAPYYGHTTVLAKDLLSKVYGLDAFNLESGSFLSYHAACDEDTGCEC